MTWFLRGLALFLAVGAIIAAIVGYRLSTTTPAVQTAQPTELVVHARTPLRAGEPIRAENVQLLAVEKKPDGSFSAISQVVDQAPMTDIGAGSPILRGHFPNAVQDMQGLRTGERAVAIKMDEVAGLGGFAKPGDQVDVLLFLHGTQETGNVSSAQIVLSGVRLLAYGDSLQKTAAGSEGLPSRTAGVQSKSATRASRDATSAVLAVPEAAAARLMLAASTGTLRLALRPHASAIADDMPISHWIKLADLSPSAQSAPQKAMRFTTTPKRNTEQSVVILHEGGRLQTVNAPH